MEILNTLLDQLMKNIKQAPGWVPTVVACYFLPLKDIARLGIDVEKKPSCDYHVCGTCSFRGWRCVG